MTELASTPCMVGWGQKPMARIINAYAQRFNLLYIALEDGFLRSYGLGVLGYPPLSIVVDKTGIYYDATRPSDLETLLEAGGFSQELLDEANRVLGHLRTYQLSKYNQSPPLPENFFDPAVRRVLVVDQTYADVSVTLGKADASTFEKMLQEAIVQNPHAQIWVKTHPDVLSGKKKGYLTQAAKAAGVHILTFDAHPHSLLPHFERVYVVTSQMGLDALIAGVPVECFGLPFYAGWGLTSDRQSTPRRTARRTLAELIAAAYLLYPRYLNPQTGQRGTFWDASRFILEQRELSSRYAGRRVFAVGFRRWKHSHVRPFFGACGSIEFVKSAQKLRGFAITQNDVLAIWGGRHDPDLERIRRETGCRLVRIEDGFVRSVGLGSDLIKPHSLVFDEDGIYFDPSKPSSLENILNHAVFSPDELARAQTIRQFIVEHQITKYNLEERKTAQWPSQGRPVVLVPGQVEDDASIRLGCTTVKTNLALLEAARKARPDAYIVYKPHPDVSSGNRQGKVGRNGAMRFADHIETKLSIISCIEACQAVHTMTSLSGFDALLRGKEVVVYGKPFYAGWGLTTDISPPERRERTLTLDELTAGTLLKYPLYWDWQLKGFTTCEAILYKIVQERKKLEADGSLRGLKYGFFQRQWRKLKGLLGPS